MKKIQRFKAIHAVLILLIIILYSYLASLFFTDNNEAITETQLSSFTELPSHKREFIAHKQDPFRSKVRPKKKKKVVKVKPKVVAKKEPKLPTFQIQGKSSHSGQIQLAISYRNQFYLVNQGDKIADMYFDLIKEDEIKIKYRDKLFTKLMPDL